MSRSDHQNKNVIRLIVNLANRRSRRLKQSVDLRSISLHKIFGGSDVVDDIENQFGTTLKQRKHLKLTLIIVSAAFAVATLAIIYQNQLFLKSPHEVENQTVVQEREQREEAEKNLKSLEECIRRYSTESDVKIRATYVRHGEELWPSMADYYKNKKHDVHTLERIENIIPLALGKGDFSIVDCFYTDHAKTQYIVEKVQGKYLLDWESNVCYQPMEWDSYLATRPTESLMFRVYMQYESVYFLPYEKEKYICLQLSALDSDQYAYAYVEKNSPLLTKIRKVCGKPVERNTRSFPALVKLRFQNKNFRWSVVEIEDVIARHWVRLNP